MRPVDVLREALNAADAWDCACDEPGNPDLCVNTERFAALYDVETLVGAADELRLWEPGRKGYAAAQDRLFAALAPFQAGDEGPGARK